MGLIRRLPSHVINQIKAGEVVERPVNVVKELVENAIDAGSNEISIELIDGGRALIRVTDNGSGISKEDLPEALERHATSKLTSVEDLDTISSLGFRGEALPTIAAVSIFSIRSRQIENSVGAEVIFEGTNRSDAVEVSMPQGTVVTVKDLFYNVPARQKFLKSTGTEFSHIQDYLQSMALAYPLVQFSCVHNGRIVFRYVAASSLAARFEQCLGAERSNFVEVDFKRGGFQVTGFAGLPHLAKALPTVFVTSVNGRIVKDRVVRAGILQSYSGLVLKGMLPPAVIFVTVEPKWVDVNAHPAKTEVRFYDAAVVQDLITIGIQDALKANIQKKADPSHSQGDVMESSKSAPTARVIAGEKYTRTARHTMDQLEDNKNEMHRSGLGNSSSISYKTPSVSVSSPRSNWKESPASPSQDVPQLIEKVQPEAQVKKQMLFDTEKTSPFASARYLGQFRNCYLIVEISQELWVLDQHAFHERILFEEFVTSFRAEQDIPVQDLLAPVMVPIPRGLGSFLNEEQARIEALGFRYEALESSAAVHGFPAFLPIAKVAPVFEEILVRCAALGGAGVAEVHPLVIKINQMKQEFSELGIHPSSLNREDVFHLFFATMACHSAVRAGDPLNEELVRRLLLRAGDVDFYAHCPHGRPVLRKFTNEDVARWFERL